MSERPEIYKKVREKLDELGFGYTATESGVEYKLIEQLFTVEEAEWFVILSYKLETTAQIAAKKGTDIAAAEKMLEQMAKNGLIFRVRKGGEVYYRAVPLIHGLYEFNIPRADASWITPMFEHIISGGLANRIIGTDTPFYRAVPLKESLDSVDGMLPYDNAEGIIEGNDKIAVAPCMCRLAKMKMGIEITEEMDTCLCFGEFADYYVENHMARYIGKDEAFQLVRRGVKAGRIIQVINSKTPEMMCSCSAKSCGILDVVRAFEGEAKAFLGNYYSETNPDKCNGKCFDICSAKCNLDARLPLDGKAVTDTAKCVGCGLCVVACPKKAINMHRKPEDKIYEPPKDAWEGYQRMNDYVRKHNL